jgi:hypothetical protein
MNTGSLISLKIFFMKTPLLFKIFIILPAIFFIDYILMVILGCATCLLGFGEDFYCGPYCFVGKIIILLSALLFIFLIFPDIKNIIKKKEHVATKEE